MCLITSIYGKFSQQRLIIDLKLVSSATRENNACLFSRHFYFDFLKRSMSVDIRLAAARCKEGDKKTISASSDTAGMTINCRLVTPGDTIASSEGFMRGHGTYVDDDSLLVASVAGVVETVNRLVSVRPLKTRYNGQIGDVVIGRITEVQQRCWKVETNSRLDSLLMLSSVNLPGGELRRRGTEDELMMRQYLQEGDLISAEVQQIHVDGCLSLHTRSLKYGKLSQGTLVRVSPSLVKRRKTHFHNLPCGASLILGNNGFVWIGPTINDEFADGNLSSSGTGGGSGGFVLNLEPVHIQDRETISRLRNCILALAAHNQMLFDTSVLYAHESSQKYQIKDLLKPEVMVEIAEMTRKRLELESDTAEMVE